MAIDVVAEFQIDYNDLLKATKDSKSALVSLKKELKETEKNFGTSSEQYVRLEASLKKTRTQYNVYSKTLQTTIDKSGQLITREKQIQEALAQEAKSVDAARASNKKLLALRNQLNLRTDAGIKANQLINEKLDENNAFIKENVSAYEQQKIGIGGYQDKIEAALQSQDLLGFSLRSVTNTLKDMYGGLTNASKGVYKFATGQDAAIKGTKGTSKALKIFRLALISTGIGAIVVAIGALVAGFLSTQEGIDKVTRVLAPLKGAFQGVVGVFQKLSLNIGSISKGVLAQFKDSFTVAKNVFLKGTDNMRLAWARVFGSKEDVAKIQDEINQKQKETLEALGRIKGRVKQVGKGWKASIKEIGEAADRQKVIEELGISIQKQENDLIKTRAELTDKIKEQEEIAKNTGKSQAERNSAVEKAKKLSDELAEKETKILELKIKQKKLQNEQNNTSREDIEELNKLEAEKTNKKTEARARDLKFLGTRNQLRKEAEAKRKKFLQEQLKQQQKQLELYLITEGKKKKGFAENLKIAEEVYKKELAIIEAKQKAGLSATEVQIEKEKALIKLQGTKTQLAVDNANKELELYILNNEFILSGNDKLNADLLQKQKDFINEKARLQKIALDKEIEDKEELEARKAEIERERKAKIAEQDKTYKEQKKQEEKAETEEKNAKANEEGQLKLLKLQEQGVSEFEIKQQQVENETVLKLQAVQKEEISEELKAAKINKINNDAAKAKKEIAQAEQDFKLGIAQTTFDNLATILGKETAAGKAAAIASATIATYQSATKAYNSMAGIPVVGPALGAVAAAAAVVSGIANVKKITSTKTPKAARGLSFSTLKGNSHASGGVGLYDESGNQVVEAEGGENVYAITNKKASGLINQRGILGALSYINQKVGGGIPLIKPVTYAQSGGLVQKSLKTSTNVNDVVDAFDNRVDRIQVVNIAEDTMNIANESVIVENEANIG